MTSADNIEKDIKTITSLYGLVCVLIISQFVPLHSVQIAGFILFPVSLIAIAVLRHRNDKDSLIHNHMTYLWRTLWIWSLLLSIALPLAGLWVYSGADHSPIQNLIEDIIKRTSYTQEELYGVLKEYMYLNKNLLILAGTTCIGPTILYIVYRLAKGMSRAFKGYRMAHPRAWF